MVGFRPIVISLMLFGLFAVALLAGGIQLAEINNANQSIADDVTIKNFSAALNQSLAGARDTANSAEDAIGDSPVTLTTGLPVIDAIGGVWKTIKVIPLTIWNLTIGVLISRMGGSFWIALTVIGAILTITIMFAVWRMVSTGDSG